MAFFDEVKTKAKKAFDFTSRKTVEISDKVNIKLSIRSTEAKMEDHYKALGKLFYDSHANGVNFDGDIVNEIKTLDALKAEKADLEIQLAKTEGKKFCPKCGAAIDAEAQFCPVCGAKADMPEPEETPKDEGEEG